MEKIGIFSRLLCNLHCNREHGGAPHKPVMLLSVIEMYEYGQIADNRIPISSELVALFNKNWGQLVSEEKGRHFRPNFATPFYHLQSEGFWRLVPNEGCAASLAHRRTIGSLSELRYCVSHAELNADLALLLLQKPARDHFRQLLLERYFSDIQVLPQPTLLDDVMEQLVAEPPQTPILPAMEPEESDFIRSGAFKREIPRIYNFTCAISGFRCSSTLNASMVDACHIVPFSQSHDDSVRNGIALSPNLHRAFDRGLISISDDYTVLIHPDFVEDESSAFNLHQFEGKQIILPFSERLYPSLDNIASHRKAWGY